jgi:hypothetical protein
MTSSRAPTTSLLTFASLVFDLDIENPLGRGTLVKFRPPFVLLVKGVVSDAQHVGALALSRERSIEVAETFSVLLSYHNLATTGRKVLNSQMARRYG